MSLQRHSDPQSDAAKIGNPQQGADKGHCKEQDTNTMKSSSMLLPLLASASAAAAAADLFVVGSYGGTIDTFSFDTDTAAIAGPLSFTNDSFPAPSWQEISADKKFLYTIEERTKGDASKGAVTSYAVGKDGALTKVSTATGLSGPVSLAVSHDGKLIFTANYDSSGCSAYSVDPSTGALTWLRDWTFSAPPGPLPQQNAPHPHQALFDRTGRFVLVPDLGADLIRIFALTSPDDPVSPVAAELEPVKLPPGTGPRHGIFFHPLQGGDDDSTASEEASSSYYYLVGELSNTVTAFAVSYEKEADTVSSSIKLTEIQRLSTLPDDYPDPLAPAAAEIALSPTTNRDGRHTLYVSNRLDNVFPGSNSIAAYTVDAADGSLQLLGLFDAAVEHTRHFAIHPSGKWLLTEGMSSNNLVVFELETDTGNIGEKKGTVEVEQPVCLTWL
ncbi:hypothetical protein VTO42DRAFT_8194 [Malbranchea cinnamomea]